MYNRFKNKLSKFIFCALFTALTLYSHSAKSQAPQAIPYQAVARDNSGAALVNQSVSFRLSIHDLTSGGTIVYQETHAATTNSLGLVTLNIGQGTPLTGTFAGVDWANGSKFIQVELDPAGGNSYTDMGTTQLMSVPYALHAGSSSDNVWTQNGNDISNNNSGNVGIGTNTPSSILTSVKANGNSAEFLSGVSYDWTSVGIGRTTTEFNLGICDDIDNFLPGTAAGDGVIRINDQMKKIHISPWGTTTTMTIADEKVGIRNTNPTANLDIAGNVKIADGTEGVGKVLTSDANGLANWQVPAPAVETDPKVGTLNTNKVPKWNGTTLEDGAITDNGLSVEVTVSPWNFLNVQSYGGGIRTGDVTQNVRLLSNGGGPTYTPLVVLTSPGGEFTLTGPGTYGMDTSTIQASGDIWIQNVSSITPTLSATQSGNVGIGTATPATKLDIAGSVKITDGTEGAGKVLTSDANGLASWLAPAPAVETDPQVSSTNNNAIPKWNGTALVDGIMTDNGNSVQANVAAFNYLNVNTYGGGLRVNNPSQSTEHATLRATNGGPFYQASLELENAIGNVFLQSPPQLLGMDTSMLTASGDMWFRNGPASDVNMTIKKTGKVGIGTTSPVEKLTVQTATANYGFTHTDGTITVGSYVGGGSGGGWFGTKSNHNLNLFTNNSSAQMTLTTAGNVGIGTTAPTAKLSVNGTSNNTTGAWGVFSDARVKTVNSEFTDGLNVINQIRPVKFTYNASAPFKAEGEQIGIVAQELEKIAPYMVSQIEYGDLKDMREVNNQAYIFLLINAVKEQQKQIEELKALINK